MTALAGFRCREFVGYALKTAEGWVCVVSLGFSWTTTQCITADAARNSLRVSAHATDFRWVAGVAELQEIIRRLPDHLIPSILPETVAEEGGVMPGIAPAVNSVWQKK